MGSPVTGTAFTGNTVGKCRVSKDNGVACRLTTNAATPWVSSQSKLHVLSILQFLFLFARFPSSRQNLAQTLGLSENTITALRNRITNCLAAWHDGMMVLESRFRYKRIQVDETYFTSRKYQRGRRQRMDRGFWIVVVCEIKEDGSVGMGHNYLVSDRTIPTLRAIVERHSIADETICTTDCFKAYDLDDLVLEHRKVNHRWEYVNHRGDHTNSVESYNSLIKRTLNLKHSLIK
jgi:hypothetical protein